MLLPVDVLEVDVLVVDDLEVDVLGALMMCFVATFYSIFNN
jgi:hypothetical protein